MVFSKGENVYDLVCTHLQSVTECFNKFMEAMDIVSNEGFNDKLKALAAQVDQLETKADSDRRRIIHTLLKGALLPESRREILKLIELIDEVANEAEEILMQITLQRIHFPEDIKQYIGKINRVIREQFNLLSEAIKSILGNYKVTDMKNKLDEIEKLESVVDDIERETIKAIYDSTIQLSRKNQLRAIISHIADISDVMEDISDILEIIISTRRV